MKQNDKKFCAGGSNVRKILEADGHVFELIMSGGVGIWKYQVVTEKTLFAMPETFILWINGNKDFFINTFVNNSLNLIIYDISEYYR